MGLHIKDLQDLRLGWQKVVDRGQYGPIYVFRYEDNVMAVTNQAQGVGELIETIVKAPH